MNRRHLLLAIILSMTLGAAYWAPESESLLVMPVERSTSVAGNADDRSAGRLELAGQPSTALQVLALQLRHGNDEPLALFSPPEPIPLVQPAPVVAPPTPPPQAPPLPFRVFGRYVDAGQQVVFLQINERNLAVRVGDVIDGQYRIESLHGSLLTFLYFPLQQMQTLDLGPPL